MYAKGDGKSWELSISFSTFIHIPEYSVSFLFICWKKNKKESSELLVFVKPPQIPLL